MRSPTKQDGTDRRSSEPDATRRRSQTVRTARASGERRAPTEKNADQGSVVTSMVDALEDILKWERASERAMRVATEQSTTELDPSN